MYIAIPQQGRDQYDRMQGVNEPVGEVKCFRCRWKGHTASMCTNPKVSNVLCALVLRGCQSDGGRVVRVMEAG